MSLNVQAGLKDVLASAIRDFGEEIDYAGSRVTALVGGVPSDSMDNMMGGHTGKMTCRVAIPLDALIGLSDPVIESTQIIVRGETYVVRRREKKTCAWALDLEEP